MTRILYAILILTFIFSCKKDIIPTNSLKIGEKRTCLYHENIVEFVDLTKLEPNTTTIDTLLLKIDSEFHSEITFIITQEFGSNVCSPLRQRINISTSKEIQLQLNQAFKSGDSVVKTSIIGDRISTDQNWAKKDNYFFTQVTGNFRIAPRPIESYIPLLFNSKHLGWLKIKMDVDSNWVIKRFFVEEYCIQQEIPTSR